MANEIVKLVAKKANISEPIAQVAVDTVLGLLKDKLPASVGGLLDSFLGSGTTTSAAKSSTSKSSTAKSSTSKSKTKESENPLGNLGDIADVLGNLFGNK